MDGLKYLIYGSVICMGFWRGRVVMEMDGLIARLIRNTGGRRVV